MATSPAPDAAAPPGMCPGLAALGTGGGSGDGNGDGSGNANGNGGNGNGSGQGAGGDGRNAKGCGAAAGCHNPVHGSGSAGAGDPIDVVTGHVYTVPEVDLFLPGPLPFVLRRSYNSGASHVRSDLGHGWGHSFAWTLHCKRTTVLVRRGDGVSARAPLPELGATVHIAGIGALTHERDGFLLRCGDGLERFFLRLHERDGRLPLSYMSDRCGNRTQLVFDEAGQLLHFVDSAMRLVRARRNARGLIDAFEVYAATERRWVSFFRYTYDDEDDLVAVTDAAGFAAHFEYAAHRLRRMVNRAGVVTHFRYDAQDRCTQTWCEDRAFAEACDAPSSRGQGIFYPTEMVFGPDGYSEAKESEMLRRYFADRSGSITKSVQNGGVVTRELDHADRVQTLSDAMGNTWSLAYAADGTVVQTDPKGGRTTHVFDANGYLTQRVDALGRAIQFTNDRVGNRLAVDDVLGRVITYAYDGRGLCTEAVFPSGTRVAYEYDASGDRTRVVESDQGARRFSYDDLGRMIEMENELGFVTRCRWDERGLLRALERAAGAVHFAYDAEERCVAITDEDGHVQRLVWAAFDVVTHVVRPDGSRIRFFYDDQCRLLRVVDAGGREHRFERDSCGRILKERSMVGASRELRYDPLDRLASLSDATGRCLSVTYDPLGRIEAKEYADDSADRFVYDAIGRLVSASAPGTEFCRSYDARGRITRETMEIRGRTYVVEQAYDLQDSRVLRRIGDGYEERVEHDACGRPTRITTTDGGVIGIDYDRRGQPVCRHLPKGGAIETRYDTAGNAVSHRVRRAAKRPRAAGDPPWVGDDESSSVEVSYLFSAAGDLREVLDTVRGDSRFSYDPLRRVVERLETAGRLVESYGFTASDDLLELTGGHGGCRYDGEGRLLAQGATELFYDAAGRLIRTSTARDGQTVERHFAYDARGMLAEVVIENGTRVAFIYDALARRLAKLVEPVEGESYEVHYLWWGDTLLQELRYAGGSLLSTRTYVSLDGVFSPLAERVASTARPSEVGDGWASSPEQEVRWQYFVHDRTGFPAHAVDAKGELLASANPTVFGRLEDEAALRSLTAVRFAGQIADEETGLYYNRHRHYDPTTGHYLEPDPLGLEGSLRPHAYVDHRPTLAVDPLGLTWATVFDANGQPLAQGASGQQGAAHHQRTSGQSALHPAVDRSLAPTVGGMIPRGPTSSHGISMPHQEAEARALSNYLYRYEAQHGVSCNPSQPGGQQNLRNALGGIGSIGSNTRKDGTGQPMAPCPSCSQTVPRLYALAGTAAPNSVFAPGNYSVPNPHGGGSLPAQGNYRAPCQGFNAAVARHNDANPNSRIPVYQPGPNGVFVATYP